MFLCRIDHSIPLVTYEQELILQLEVAKWGNSVVGTIFLKTQSAESRTIHVREPEPAIIPSEEPLLGTRGQLVIESFPAIN